MGKTVLPGMSLQTSGKFGGAIVFASWKGRPYIRQLVKPSNPKTDAQIGVRAGMKFLGPGWSALTAAQQATFDAPAQAAQITSFNVYSKVGQTNLGQDKGPQNEYSPAQVTLSSAVIDLAESVSGKSVTLTWTDPAEAGQYSILVHLNGSAGFTLSRSNLRSVITQDKTSVTISGLKAGTYYAKLKYGSTSGDLGPVSNEVTITIT